ncbi:MAG TPA: hypothetical protein P5526_04870 [Anaerolineae bacterium]|nr:hypothetical protein [Anaerolineae bacterium]
MNENQTNSKWTLAIEWLVVIAIVALATFLRYWRIGEVPPGFNSDEAVGAVGALTTLREGFKYSYEGQGGGGALGFYFAAVAFYLFGPSIETIRGLAAWAGVVSIFVNYWAVREVFRNTGLNRARWLAGLSTLGLAVSLWHVAASRIAFAGIGVPFLMLPSVYFLWRGLNTNTRSLSSNHQPSTMASSSPAVSNNSSFSILHSSFSYLPFIASGIFLGGLMYIYLSGVFFPPFYAIFFVSQWLIVKLAQKLKWPANPPEAYMTTQFWRLFATGLTAILLLLPVVFVLLFRPELEPGTTRASQAIFTNPQINQGDPWGLLWRSIVGNFGGYGISLNWFIGQLPARLTLPPTVGLMVFLGFLISIWQSIRRGQAAYLFTLLWFCVLLLPSILSPDIIPHNLRTIGATTPTYVFAAIFIVTLFETLWAAGRRWLRPNLKPDHFTWLARAAGLVIAVGLTWLLWQANSRALYNYFVLYPQTNDAKAAYHVYAVEMAETINREPSRDVAFILPRNTAAGDVFRNFATDFLTDLAEPPAAHYWVIDDEDTLTDDLTAAAAEHTTLRVVRWKTSKHTGADPKEVIPYYLEKYGHYEGAETFEYFDIDTYRLDAAAPDFHTAESLTPTDITFGDQLALTGYALGDAGNPAQIDQPEVASNDLLWLRLGWQKTGDHAEDLKVSALIYNETGQLVTQVDKQLISNILQVSSSDWAIGANEATYFLIVMPPATPPGQYSVRLAVYGAESLNRLPVSIDGQPDTAADRLVDLAPFQVTPAQKPVTADDLELALPIQQELLPGLTLVGFETLPGDTVRAGQEVGASVIWQLSGDKLTDDITMHFIAKPEEGKTEFDISEPVGLAGPGYPTSQWQTGEILRGWLKARIPPSFEPGIHKLSLSLSGPAGEIIRLPIGDFQVEGWPRNFDPPQPQVEIKANYGDQAELIGLDAATNTLSPGDTLSARLYWQAESEFAEDYKVFVQLIGPDGLLHGQVDQIPGGGQFPTTGWLPGEYITDDYAVALASDAPPGDYQIAIGLYNSNTGQRLPVESPTCQSDACLLPGLTVQ